MKSVTEFWSAVLVRGINAKTALAAESKTPEEIQQNIGETFKLEGDKLKYFMGAMDVASKNMEKLSRVLVVSYAEGESANPKATKIEEMYYIPEFQKDPKAIVTQKSDSKGGGQGKGKPRSGGGPKESPWGLSPEQKAAKKGGGANKAPKPTT